MAVAGTFYPNDPQQLNRLLDEYFGAEVEDRQDAVAIIGPHAGLVYSGPIAGSAYNSARSAIEQAERIVLIGPSHRVGFHGVALSGYRWFESPIGALEIDQEAYDILKDMPGFTVREDAHALEHGLEVHLPFIQRVAKATAKLVPLVVGQVDDDQLAAGLDAIIDETTFVIISSDLSHFHDYETARRLDAQTSQAIQEKRPDDIDGKGACGAAAIRGYLHTAASSNLGVEIVDLRNSGDTAGGKDRVVGYGAYVFR